MKNLENLKNILELFDKNRENEKKYENSKLSDPNNREEYAQAIAECFKPCSAKILAGHFEVTDLEGNKRCIYPTAIELYYHEEDNGTDEVRFKDPIMYHTNDRKIYDFYKNKEYFDKHFNNDNFDHKDNLKKIKYYSKRNLPLPEKPFEIPYFPIGSLNPHTSGIDITFENPNEKYRASCLIRKYKIQFGANEPHPIENSTDIYEDMLINGIPLDNNVEWIEWVPGNEKKIKIERGWRQNVPNYRQYKDSPELWEKVEVKEEPKKDPDTENTFSINKIRYVKCPFNWQFRIKNPQNNN